MIDYKAVFEAVTKDPRYKKNVKWGEPRPGHFEGAVSAHIEELERNLELLQPRLSEIDYWKLKLLVHTHDTFKSEAKPGVPISDPLSHSSVARDFLAAYCDDPDLNAMVQYHDEPFALWRQLQARGDYNRDRFAFLLKTIKDWNVFLAFNIIDGCTANKSREPLVWLFKELAGKIDSTITQKDIL